VIRSLRERHRVAALFMAVGLPVLLLAALKVRPGPMTGGTLPEELQLPIPSTQADPFAIRRLGTLPVHVSLLVYADRPPELLIMESGAIGHPDVLLYWTPDRNISGESPGLPSDAKLIGSLGRGRSIAYPLPAEAAITEGSLLAYSLATQETVGSVDWPAVGSAMEEASP